jgi:hypothetical protein
MNDYDFVGFARRAAGGVSRRASILTLGTAGLATLQSPFSIDAKNRNNNDCKHDKKRCNQDLAECTAQAAECTAQAAQCASQVQQCTTFLTALCEGEPECLDSVACCSVLENCDFNGFFACLVGTGAS